MDLVSVIVPIYNVERYLKRCIESILNQSYSNLEIILVDDGSPDASGEICDTYEKNDKRVKVIHKKNEGLGYARNSGLSLVTGKYVTFIDSDDWIGENHILNLYNFIKKNEADLVIGGYTSVNSLGESEEAAPGLANETYEEKQVINEILLPLIGSDIHSPNDVQLQSSCCMNLYKVQVIRENKIQFPSERYAVAEDLFFNVDFLFFSNKVVVSDEVAYFYFQNMESISRKYNPKRYERTNNFYVEMKKKIDNYDLEKLAELRLERTYLMKIRVALRLIVMSDLKYKQKKYEIAKILADKILIDILEIYPIDSFVHAMRVLMYFIKRKNIQVVYGLIALREHLNQNKFFERILNKVGIKR